MDQDNLKNVIDKAFDNISDIGLNTKGEIRAVSYTHLTLPTMYTV